VREVAEYEIIMECMAEKERHEADKANRPRSPFDNAMGR
jgi:hypothetical protein